jgi:DNA-binding NtrC family response regulator
MSAPDTSQPPTVDVAVLDDDTDFLTYIEDLLHDEGMYAVRTFSHPEHLFRAAEQRVPDIVLLDMKMGEFRGEQVLEQLLAKWPNLCVIIVTGYPSLDDMRASFKKRVFDYIPKPFSIAQFRQTLSGSATESSYCASSGTGH